VVRYWDRVTKFCKVSAIEYLQYQAPTRSTFENLCLFGNLLRSRRGKTLKKNIEKQIPLVHDGGQSPLQTGRGDRLEKKIETQNNKKKVSVPVRESTAERKGTDFSSCHMAFHAFSKMLLRSLFGSSLLRYAKVSKETNKEANETWYRGNETYTYWRTCA